MHIVHGQSIGDLSIAELQQLLEQLIGELPEGVIGINHPLIAEIDLVEEELCLRES